MLGNRSWFLGKAFNKVFSICISLTASKAALLLYYKSKSYSVNRSKVCRIAEHGTKATQEIIETLQVKRGFRDVIQC